MKINGNHNVHKILASYHQVSKDAPATDPAKPVKKESIELSPVSRTIRERLDALKKDEGISPRALELKKQVDEGTYRVSVEELADRMMAAVAAEKAGR